MQGARVIIGWVVLVMGIVVIVGWVAGIPRLIQSGAGLGPTQINAALAFALTGVGLLVLERAPRWAAAAALVVLLIGAATLAQYLFGISLGIDGLLITPWMETQSTHPGRMSPSSAIAHTACALGLLAHALKLRNHLLWGALLGVVIVMVSAHGALVYLIYGARTLIWGELTRMALISVPFHLALGLWLLLNGWRKLRDSEPAPRVAFLTAALMCLVSLLGWQAVLRDRGRWIEAGLEDTADTAAEVLEDELTSRVLALHVMGNVGNGAIPSPVWRSDAHAIARRFPSYVGFAWVAPDGTISWYERIYADPDRLLPILQGELPIGDRAVLFLEQAGWVAIAVPAGQGHLVGIADGSAMLTHTIPSEIRESFAITLLHEGRVIGRHAIRRDDPLVKLREFEMLGSRWAVQLAPETIWLDETRSTVPEVLLFLGIALGLALAVALYAGQETALRSAELARANEALRASRDELEDRVARRTEELHAANLELARSNRDLEHFASVASHDLKEPLNTVALQLQLLSRRLEVPDTERAWLDRAVESLQRMARMVDELLTLARIESAPAPEPTDLGEVVNRVVSSLEARIVETGAQIRVAEEMPMVLANPGQLAHVLQNLIGNALKFGGPAPVVEVEAHLAGSEVQVTVRDHGPGIEPSVLQRVFEMFGKGQASSGAGIGLAISKRIIEHLGGRMGVDSAPGSGACFWFVLPTASSL